MGKLCGGALSIVRQLQAAGLTTTRPLAEARNHAVEAPSIGARAFRPSARHRRAGITSPPPPDCTRRPRHWGSQNGCSSSMKKCRMKALFWPQICEDGFGIDSSYQVTTNVSY
jgi:hypothetical protein